MQQAFGTFMPGKTKYAAIERVMFIAPGFAHGASDKGRAGQLDKLHDLLAGFAHTIAYVHHDVIDLAQLFAQAGDGGIIGHGEIVHQ